MKKEIAKALKEARKGKPRNFTQSVELAITLKNLDFKKPDSRVKGDVVLPHGRGKPLKIGAFAEGDMGVRARKAGLKVFGKKDIQSLGEDKKKAKKIVSEHEFFIAQTDLMPLVGRTLGPVLGRSGKMPRPLSPVAPLEPLVEKLKKTVYIDSKNKNVVHSPIGTEKMSDEELTENAESILNFVEKNLSRGMDNIESIYLKFTMGSAIKVI